jgi:hypothetical protein
MSFKARMAVSWVYLNDYRHPDYRHKQLTVQPEVLLGGFHPEQARSTVSK